MKKNFLIVLVLIALAIVSCKDKVELRDIESSLDIDVEYSPEEYAPGATVNGTDDYVKIIVGDYESPIILASPHDGTLEPSFMTQERNHSTAVTVRDIYVTDLILRMADSLKKLTGYRPHLIINNLHRKHMEPNRALADAYHKYPEADKAWLEYHKFLKIARKIVKENVGKGLFLDMHGHGHDKQRTEVGYLLTSNDLNNTDESINYMAYKSSIFSMGSRSHFPFSSLINGDAAFGTFMANYGCPAVPSKQDPRPFADQYFNGGYCTSTYGSRINDDGIDAIQLETPGSDAGSMRYSAATRRTSGGRMARAIIEYMKLNYDMDLMK